MESVRKEEVEKALGFEITDSEFKDALKYAQIKQSYSFSQNNNPVIMQKWYLIKLTEECVRNLAFSRFTMQLCELNNMERAPQHMDGTPSNDNHIVSRH